MAWWCCRSSAAEHGRSQAEQRRRLARAGFAALALVVHPYVSPAHATPPAMDLQHLIDHAPRDADGSAVLTLRAVPGLTTVVVDAPLHLTAGLHLTVAPGLVLQASNDQGRTDRTRPVFIIAGTPEAPIANVALRGVRLHGNFAHPPIVIHNAAGITIADGEIAGSRGGGIEVNTGRRVSISGMTMHFMRVPSTDPAARSVVPPEGGAGIWCFACNDTTVSNNSLDATPFWQPGPSWDSGNAAVCITGKVRPGCTMSRTADDLARALDLIAFYGGARNTIAGNRLTHGNTAGVYINIYSKPNAEFPANPTDFRVQSNQISDMREHGIDMVGAIRPSISANRIAHVGGAGIALATTHAAVITGNTIGFTAEAWHSPSAHKQTGGIKLMLQTAECQITANHIAPGGAAYAIFFENGTARNIAGGPSPTLDNSMSPGSDGLANTGLPPDTNEVWMLGRRINRN